MEAIHSSETTILTRGTRRNIPDDGILHLRFAAVAVNSDISLNMMPYRLIVYRRFGGIYCFHIQARKVNRANSTLCVLLAGYLLGRHLAPKIKQMIPLRNVASYLPVFTLASQKSRPF
jgi:hypothetical protein